MALSRGTGARTAVQTITIGTETVDIPAYVSVDASGNPVNSSIPATLTAARISFAVTGDQTIVAAVASQVTSVYRFRLSVAGATNITVKNGATTLEVIQFAAAGSLVLDYSTRAYWATSTNTAFIIASSAAVQVEGRVEYVTA